MKRISIIGSALLAALAVTAVLASAASAAAPEWGRCVPAEVKGTGEFLGKGCAKSAEGKGAYNWAPEPTGKAVLTGAGEEITLESAKHKIVCAASTYTGKFTGAKTATVSLDLIGCNVTSGTTKQECQSSPVPEKESEIEAEYEAELGFIKGGEHPKVGIDLKPKSTITFTCGKLPEVPLLSGTIEGSVIGQVTPINHMGEEFKLVHSELKGVQTVRDVRRWRKRHADGQPDRRDRGADRRSDGPASEIDHRP